MVPLIKIIFFGTHEFAATILEGLLGTPGLIVTHVVTQPDKPAGRGGYITAPPVKLCAADHGIHVMQPEKLDSLILIARAAHVAIVAQYGKLMPPKLVDAPMYGTLNVHTSLLPLYRGASPIQSAILNGDTKTGVTIMKMNAGLDTGPILTQKQTDIPPFERYPELSARLALLGTQALAESLFPYIEGRLSPIAQDESKATLCKQLSREDGKVNWNSPVMKIYNQYRAFDPWPGIWTIYAGKRLKLLRVEPIADMSLIPGLALVQDGSLYVGCQGGAMRILEVQLEGKKNISVESFLQGNAIHECMLGSDTSLIL